MKKYILASIMMLMVAALGFAKGNEGKPSAKFTEVIWDFGTIKKDRPASHDFEFVNDGTGNLVILNATAECGCTKPEFPDKPIAPGKKGKIKVTYNPNVGTGSFEKTVTVKTNGNPKKVRLKIRGTVAP